MFLAREWLTCVFRRTAGIDQDVKDFASPLKGIDLIVKPASGLQIASASPRGPLRGSSMR